jgi:hypothetical protein
MVDRMSQRNSHRSIAEGNRLATVAGLLQARGTLLLAPALISLSLVLLITNGGAG